MATVNIAKNERQKESSRPGERGPLDEEAAGAPKQRRGKNEE